MSREQMKTSERSTLADRSAGNLISAQLQRRKVPVVAGSAWGMLYGAAALALWAALRGESEGERVLAEA
jgi:hypothetical protein